MDFGQAKTVIWSWIPVAATNQGAERNLNKLPASGVVGEASTPAFSGVAVGGAAVVEQVEVDVVARVVAVEPEAYTFVAAPILGNPIVNRFVFKRVGEAAILVNVVINLEQVVVATLTGQSKRIAAVIAMVIRVLFLIVWPGPGLDNRGIRHVARQHPHQKRSRSSAW